MPCLARPSWPSLLAGAAFVFALAPGSAARAQGGPPMLTDDPDTPGDGKFEVNLAATVDTTPAAAAFETPQLDANYGIGEHIQLNYLTSLVSQVAPGSERDYGMSQNILAVKYRFIDPPNETSGLSVSTYPKVVFRAPGASRSETLAPHATQLQLPVEAKVALNKDLAETAEIGSYITSGKPTGWFYGDDWGYSLVEHFTLMVEAWGQTLSVPRQSSWLVNIGARWETSETLDVIASAGRYIKAAGPVPEAIGYAGVALHF